MGCHPDGCGPCSMPRYMRGVDCPGPSRFTDHKKRLLKRARMPADYMQKRRAAKREEDLALFKQFDGTGGGFVSRHLEDPEGSQRWVEMGKWEE